MSELVTTSQHRTHHARLRDDEKGKFSRKLRTFDAVKSVVPTLPDFGPAVEQQPALKQGLALAAPTTNRGPDFTNPLFLPSGGRCHQLRASFFATPEGSVEADMRNLLRVRELVSAALHCQAEEGFRGFWSYDESCRWLDPEGGMLASLNWEVGRREACLDIKGQGCDRMGTTVLRHLIRDLAGSIGIRLRRVDCAFDDYQRIASIDDVREAIAEKNFSGFFKHNSRKPGDVRKDEPDGDSAEFGRPGNDGSGKFLRIYDKYLEQIAKGVPPEKAEDCIRWEVEFSDEKAEALLPMLLSPQDDDSFAKQMAGLAVGQIKFVDRSSGDPNISRLPLLPWWERLLKSAARAIAVHSTNYGT